MEITRRCDYACRILRAVYNSGDTYVSVSDIADNENIPYSFARSIQHDLVKGGLIKTMRGSHGGLTLNCNPSQVTLLEVLEIIQGPVSVSPCATDPQYCEKYNECVYNKLWQGADCLLDDYFASITLKDLIEQGIDHPTIGTAIAKGRGKAASAFCSRASSCALIANDGEKLPCPDSKCKVSSSCQR